MFSKNVLIDDSDTTARSSGRAPAAATQEENSHGPEPVTAVSSHPGRRHGQHGQGGGVHPCLTLSDPSTNRLFPASCSHPKDNGYCSRALLPMPDAVGVFLRPDEGPSDVAFSMGPNEYEADERDSATIPAIEASAIPPANGDQRSPPRTAGSSPRTPRSPASISTGANGAVFRMPGSSPRIGSEQIPQSSCVDREEPIESFDAGPMADLSGFSHQEPVDHGSDLPIRTRSQLNLRNTRWIDSCGSLLEEVDTPSAAMITMSKAANDEPTSFEQAIKSSNSAKCEGRHERGTQSPSRTRDVGVSPAASRTISGEEQMGLQNQAPCRWID